MQGDSGDKIRLRHILDAVAEIEKYIAAASFDEFLTNSMMRFACIKQLEIIGEASNHISESARKAFSEIEWEQIIGMRNVFVHEYFGIDIKLAWEIIIKDVPELKEKVTTVLAKLP